VRVELRPVEDDDMPTLFAQQADPASVAMAGVPARDRPAFDEHWQRIRGNPEIVLRTIVVDGEPAGHIVCFLRDRRRELGYWLGQSFWGRGIATAAVQSFLASYDVRPLVATVLAKNTASVRILQGCGFVHVGADGDLLTMQLD